MRIFENLVIPFSFEIYKQGKHMAYLVNGACIHSITPIDSTGGKYMYVRLFGGLGLIETLYTSDGFSVDGRFEDIVLEEIRCEKDNSVSN